MKLNPSHLYTIRDLRFSYPLEEQRVQALRDVTLTIEKGEFACLSGPSGSGKTTLLNILGLIESVQEGLVLFQDQELKALSEREKNRIRRYKIGFVFQSFQLFPVLRADENVEYFLTRQGIPRKERSRRVDEALDAVGLREHRAKRPLEMSGGQRQRVALARAIAKRPEVIIADEPTASLDQNTGRGIMEIFKRMNDEKHVTVIVSSHDPMVHAFAPRRLEMKDGFLC